MACTRNADIGKILCSYKISQTQHHNNTIRKCSTVPVTNGHEYIQQYTHS